ncbi:MAG: NADH-quinone oxidoreductase subunit N, partial [Pirellulaceae bacterium]
MFSLAGYILAGAVMYQNESPLWRDAALGSSMVSGPIVIDYLGYLLRWAAILVGILFTLVASGNVRRELSGEYFGTLMLLIVGIMLVSRANDLVLLFVSLELISIPTYVLLYLGRRDRATAEATAKYFFLSIFSSAILLYGISFVYGVTGTTVLTVPGSMPAAGEAAGTPDQLGIASMLANLASSRTSPALLQVATVLVAAGLGFKIAAVPFHFYAPDVFQGATNGNAGVLAVAPKLGGLAALIRLMVVAMPDSSHLAWQLLFVMAIATMTLGNICALWQKNIRRLLAFSSIAHAGYMLIGVTVAVGTRGAEAGGVSSAVLYVLLYTVASAGIFAALAYAGSSQREVNSLEDLAGLSTRQPLTAAVLAICLFSLAGIPPLAGFWGKLTLFSGAIHAASARSLVTAGPNAGVWMTALAVVGAVNAAIASAYYLRVVAVMYFGTTVGDRRGEGGWGARVAMSLAAALVILLGVFPGSVLNPTRRAEQILFRPPVSSTLPASNLAALRAE